MTHEQYHREQGVSASMLKLLASKSPYHVWHEYLRPDREWKQPTPAMKLGTLVHAIVLEEETVCDRFIVFEGDRRTKAGKEEYQEIIESGAEPVSVADMRLADAIAHSVKLHKIAGPLFEKGHAEVSKFRKRGTELLPQKCRLDFLSPSGIIELKTTADASPAGFARQIYRMGYHLQAAFYADMYGVTDINGFTFVAVETTPPYPVGVYIPSPEMMQHGRELYARMLAQFDDCWRKQEWPGYDCGLIMPPGWAGNKADNEIPLGELEI